MFLSSKADLRVAPVGRWGGEDPGVEHALDPDVAGVLRLAGHLLVRVPPGAVPVSHLMTQVEPLQASDVILVAKGIVKVLERAGMSFEASVGEMVPFDPNRHEPMSDDPSLKPGDPYPLCLGQAAVDRGAGGGPEPRGFEPDLSPDEALHRPSESHQAEH